MSIKLARANLRQKKIAMVRADLIGHGLGGVLARIWAEAGLGEYLRADNFYAGDINKLITINSPHKGSFAADLAVKFISEDYLPIGVREELISLLEAIGRPNKGALYDLIPTSDQIAAINKTPAFTSVHVIAGDVVVPGTADSESLLMDLISNQATSLCPERSGVILDMLISDLKPYVDEYIKNVVDGHSDTVVSLDSQTGGIGWGLAASSILNNRHDVINDNTANEVVNLLNANPDTTSSPFFASGFPLTQKMQ